MSKPKAQLNRINLRLSHPNLWLILVGLGVGCVAIGLNFLFLKPAFNPLDIPKEVFGWLFLTLGLVELLFLNFLRNWRLLRLVAALLLALLTFYAILLTYQFFEKNQTSMQLPITYIMIVWLVFASLKEPFINPITDKNGGGNGQ